MTDLNMVAAMILAKGLAADDPADPLRAGYDPVDAVLAAADRHGIAPRELASYLGGEFASDYDAYAAKMVALGRVPR